jgi:hypothetical protein
VDRDSSVVIATRYGLDGPGIESRCGRDFPHASRPGLGATQPPIQWVPSLSVGKAAGAWPWLSTPSSADVKERVELYLYSTSGPSWPVIGWILPLTMKEYPNRITRPEGFKAVDINPVVYCVITLRRLVDGCQRFGGIYWLYFQVSGELSWKAVYWREVGRQKRAKKNRVAVTE